MRTALLPVLALATVACSSLGPSAHAEDPASSAAYPVESGRPILPAPRLEVVDDADHLLPTFFQGGRRYVLGTIGERYSLHLVNPSSVRVEAVVSVDGLDAIDGKPASTSKRGYLIPAYGEVTVDGWRTSLERVAAFRFSSVRGSYAARTGHDRNVGVIGVAFFRERPAPVVVYPPSPHRATRAATADAEPSSPSGSAPAPAAPAPASRSAAGGSPAAADRRAEKSDARPGLGTEFGEAHDSYATEVPFERASARPDSVVELRYDDRGGLVARGIRIPPVDLRLEENERRDRAEAFPEARFAQPPR